MNTKPHMILLPILLAVALACQSPLSAPQETQAAPLTVESPTPTLTSGGPCDNVLYPLREGTQWVYQVTNDEGTSQVGLTVSSVSDSRATVDALHLGSGVITQSTVECEAGAIKNFPLMTLGLIFGEYVEGQINVQYVSGLVAPAHAAFLTNDWALTWEGEYLAAGTLHVQDEGEEVTITLDQSPLRMKWQTAGAGEAAFEGVTVAAGMYPHALKVSRDAEMDVTVQMVSADGTFSGEAKIMVRTTHWFEPFVGLLKAQVESASVQYRGLTFPVVLTSTVELLQYIPAQ